MPAFRAPVDTAVDTTQLHPLLAAAAMDDDDISSPFAATAAGPKAVLQSNLASAYTSGSVSDADAAAIAAEAADDLSALPDASARTPPAPAAAVASAAALRAKAAPPASSADTSTQRTTSGRRKPRKLIPLKLVRVTRRPLLVHATSFIEEVPAFNRSLLWLLWLNCIPSSIDMHMKHNATQAHEHLCRFTDQHAPATTFRLCCRLPSQPLLLDDGDDVAAGDQGLL